MVSVMGKNLQTEATFQSEPGPTEWISQSRTFTVLYSLKKQRIYSTFSPEKSHAAHQTSYVWWDDSQGSSQVFSESLHQLVKTHLLFLTCNLNLQLILKSLCHWCDSVPLGRHSFHQFVPAVHILLINPLIPHSYSSRVLPSSFVWVTPVKINSTNNNSESKNYQAEISQRCHRSDNSMFVITLGN